MKKVAIYGTYRAKMPVTFKQRFWKRRKDGVKQRYWKKVTRTQKTTKSGRYEFSGRRNLYHAMRIAHQIMPKGFIDVSTEEFLQQPYEYGYEGKWIERTIKS
jgi:hypothetical protein